MTDRRVEREYELESSVWVRYLLVSIATMYPADAAMKDYWFAR